MTKETLLQRLRQYEGAQWETTACYNGLRDEAAAEIDRMREAVDTFRQNADAWETKCNAAWAERDQWREAHDRVDHRAFALAQERDRLREALQTAEYQTQRYKDALDKNASFEQLWEEVSDEIDRLREALEKIVAGDFTMTDDGVRLSRRIAGPFAKIAKAALAKEAGK